MTGRNDFSTLSPLELSALLHAAITELAGRDDPAAFAELLQLSAHLGTCIGEAARSVAAQASWSHVAGLSGTTKQAAWSRWSTP